MKYKVILIFFILGLSVTQQGLAQDTLQYTYFLTQDKQDQQYLFTITFTGNVNVISVNMTVNGAVMILHKGLDNNTFYSFIATNIQNKIAELTVTTAYSGVKLVSFTIQKKLPTQKPITDELVNELTNLIGFIIILGLVAKYVLFYVPKESK